MHGLVLCIAVLAQSADSPSQAVTPQIRQKAGTDWPCFLGPTGDSQIERAGHS